MDKITDSNSPLDVDVAEKLESLRSQFKDGDTTGACLDAWKWLDRLGAQSKSNRTQNLQLLNQLFVAGDVPKNLDGPTEGKLVTWAANPGLDKALSSFTSIWLPWVGKKFDAANNSGVNVMTREVWLLGRLIWPSYSFGKSAKNTIGFEFTTRVEPAIINSDNEVLVIDYQTVPRNPRLIIRSVRDELVALLDGVYLGRMLLQTKANSEQSYRLVNYFALRSPQV